MTKIEWIGTITRIGDEHIDDKVSNPNLISPNKLIYTDITIETPLDEDLKEYQKRGAKVAMYGNAKEAIIYGPANESYMDKKIKIVYEAKKMKGIRQSRQQVYIEDKLVIDQSVEWKD